MFSGPKTIDDIHIDSGNTFYEHKSIRGCRINTSGPDIKFLDASGLSYVTGARRAIDKRRCQAADKREVMHASSTCMHHVHFYIMFTCYVLSHDGILIQGKCI